MHLCQAKPNVSNCTFHATHCMKWLDLGMSNGQDYLPKGMYVMVVWGDVWWWCAYVCGIIYAILTLISSSLSFASISLPLLVFLPPPASVCEADDAHCLKMYKKCLHLLTPAKNTPQVSPGKDSSLGHPFITSFLKYVLPIYYGGQSCLYLYPAKQWKFLSVATSFDKYLIPGIKIVKGGSRTSSSAYHLHTLVTHS